jgi:hypothetical protein
LSSEGRILAIEREQKSSKQALREVHEREAGGIRAHIASLVEQAKQQGRIEPTDAQRVLRFLEDREIMADLLTGDSAELLARIDGIIQLNPFDANDPVLRVLDNPTFAARLARFIGGPTAEGREMAARRLDALRAKRDDVTTPQIADMRDLASQFDSLYQTALKEIGGASEPSATAA